MNTTVNEPAYKRTPLYLKSKGLRQDDVKGYKDLDQPSLNRAIVRARRIIENIQLIHGLKESRTETSILPPHLIIECWYNQAPTEQKSKCYLKTSLAFDGGTNFKIVLK
jgi:hypothetical protein